jgi:hypothetical protein
VVLSWKFAPEALCAATTRTFRHPQPTDPP